MASHRQTCPARGKNCKNCEIAIHFAKVCRKTKLQLKPKQRVNNADDTSSEEATVCTSATAGELANQIETMFQKRSIYDANYDSDYDKFYDNCVAIISDSGNISEVEPVNVHIRIRNTETKALVDSGSVCAIINKSLANAVVSNCQDSFWVQSPEMHELNTFFNELIKIIGVINTSVECNDWIATNVNVKDGQRLIIGRVQFIHIQVQLSMKFANNPAVFRIPEFLKSCVRVEN